MMIYEPSNHTNNLMKTAPIPANERDQLGAVLGLKILDIAAFLALAARAEEEINKPRGSMES